MNEHWPVFLKVRQYMLYDYLKRDACGTNHGQLLVHSKLIWTQTSTWNSAKPKYSINHNFVVLKQAEEKVILVVQVKWNYMI